MNAQNATSCSSSKARFTLRRSGAEKFFESNQIPLFAHLHSPPLRWKWIKRRRIRCTWFSIEFDAALRCGEERSGVELCGAVRYFIDSNRLTANSYAQLTHLLSSQHRCALLRSALVEIACQLRRTSLVSVPLCFGGNRA